MKTSSVLTLVLAFGVSSFAQSRPLDDFATVDGWSVATSEGAHATVDHASGKAGGALVLDFDLSQAYGHAIARKAFDLELPANYQLTFDLRGECPVNNFEVKFIDEHENVWWFKRLAVKFPEKFETQHVRKRHLSFAWGPLRTPEIKHVRAIEFVVSSATGGKGRIFVSNLRFEPIDDAVAASARAKIAVTHGAPQADARGTVVENWSVPASANATSATGEAALTLDFGYEREFGGLVLDWAPGKSAACYAVQSSSDGREWQTLASVQHGNGGRDYVFLPERQGNFLRLAIPAADAARGIELVRLEVQPPQFGLNENAFAESIARRERRGLFPKYYVGEQCFWTTAGSPADGDNALIGETGQIEVARSCFTVEPFLYVDGQLVTWSDVQLSQSLENGYLPIPTVEWKRGDLTLRITTFAAGPAGPNSVLLTRYHLANAGAAVKGKLFLAIRPFQVNPPWQSLFRAAGWARIDRVQLAGGVVQIDDRHFIPLDRPDGFGATPFESGEIVEHLARGVLPSATTAEDATGFASAALAYDFDLATGASKEVRTASPFHPGGDQVPVNVAATEAASYVDAAHAATRAMWEAKLDLFQVRLPASAQPVIDTIKSNLAYIFINQDGARFQPGSRNYQRSWIRDGSLTSTALLELGLNDSVRAFADWYAPFQFPSGKVPCVVDHLGADPTPENDSHGQLIYLFMQVYHFTHDQAWLREKWPHVVRTVRYIQELRATRKAEPFISGTPEQRALYGLMPESISHEGYSAKPMHSYWDDAFTLRGLKDATTIAEILGETAAAKEFAAERDDFRKDFYNSIRLAMQNTGVDYIPGCAELGDFDATSTTVLVQPGNEVGQLPEPALHRTFEKYFERFVARRDGKMEWLDLTPYENRVIGSFVYLGQKDRAQACLDFFMSLRRPAGWNHWAEVAFRDRTTPRTIGDMPHTWCGSDFIRSVRGMFVFEREQDEALVLAAGVADAWVTDPAGIEVISMPTYYGKLSYTVKSLHAADGSVNRVDVTISEGLQLPPGGVIVRSPLSRPIRSVSGDGRPLLHENGEIRIDRLPAKLSIAY
ncbi:MAG: discoidin domain-containing protein [Opitutae bacterium]|nr:discoidin domain-containing protein [Opitutae bacterium]